MSIQKLAKYFVIASAPTSTGENPLGDTATVLVNGKTVGRTRAYLLDRQLKERNLIFWFPHPLQAGDVVRICQKTEDGIDHCAEGVYKTSPFPELAETGFTVSLPDWAVDSIIVSDGVVRISGWILLPNIGDHFDIFVNGKLVKNISTSSGRTDVANAWQSISALTRPFSFEGQVEVERNQPSLELVLKHGGHSLALNSYWYPAGIPRYPIPDERRRARVYGYSDQDVFLRLGYTTYRRLNEIISAFFKTHSQGRQPTLLDWGCGCGGIGRYFVGDSRWKYVGVDIDHDNIAWCKDNIDSAAFEVVPLRPPTRFQDHVFDVVFGVSVFTHLHEADQLLWLKELARIMSPQSIGLFSILGAQATARMPSLQHDAKFMTSGFLFAEDSHEIGKLVGESSYYGTAYHHYGYIAGKWSEYFDLLAYIPAGLSQQDIVVVRPKK